MKEEIKNLSNEPITWSIASGIMLEVIKSEAASRIRSAIFRNIDDPQVIKIGELIENAVREIKSYINFQFEENRLKDIRAGIDMMQRNIHQFYNNRDEKILHAMRLEGSKLFSLNKEMRSAGYPSFFLIANIYLVVLNELSEINGNKERKNMIDFLVEILDYYESKQTYYLKEGVALRYEGPVFWNGDIIAAWTFKIDGKFPPFTREVTDSNRAPVIPKMNKHYNNTYSTIKSSYSFKGDDIEKKWIEMLKKYVNSNKELKDYFIENYKNKVIQNYKESTLNNIQIIPDREFLFPLINVVAL